MPLKGQVSNTKFIVNDRLLTCTVLTDPGMVGPGPRPPTAQK